MSTPSPTLHPTQPRPYAHLTVAAANLSLPPQPALPRLVEPARMPLVGEHSRAADEPLVPVTDAPGVVNLGAYASTDIPGAPRVAWARSGAVERLAVAADLLPDGYGLAVFDAWRPLSVQQHLFEAAYATPGLPDGFVTPPSKDPASPPPHLTGGTADVTLTVGGVPLALGTAFDDFSPLAHTDAFEDRPGTVREHRRLLCRVMAAAGWKVLAQEWWHFEIGTRRWAALTGHPVMYPAAASPSCRSIDQRPVEFRAA